MPAANPLTPGRPARNRDSRPRPRAGTRLGLPRHVDRILLTSLIWAASRPPCRRRGRNGSPLGGGDGLVADAQVSLWVRVRALHRLAPNHTVQATASRIAQNTPHETPSTASATRPRVGDSHAPSRNSGTAPIPMNTPILTIDATDITNANVANAATANATRSFLLGWRTASI